MLVSGSVKEMRKINIIGELPSLVVAFETDKTAYCVKCKCKVTVGESQYKPYPNNRILERGICKSKVEYNMPVKGCGSKVRSFRKARYYSKTSYGGTDYHRKLYYPKTEFVNLERILGKERAKEVYRATKYAPLRSVVSNLRSITMEPETVAKLVVKARYIEKETRIHEQQKKHQKQVDLAKQGSEKLRHYLNRMETNQLNPFSSTEGYWK